jgi:hypothetical protein
VITATASIIAFFTTCFAVGSAANDIGVGMVAGTVAGGAVVLGIWLIGNRVLKKFRDQGPGKPR